MPSLDCTLLTDGSSDIALLPILEWVIRQHTAEAAVHCEWADLRRLPSPPHALDDRIVKAVELYPCQLLFVHRDAEGQDPARRYDEIRAAVQTAREKGVDLPHVCVVPVRMQEAWLLLDPAAIRRAADNPRGMMDLGLPLPKHVEGVRDPKAQLYGTLRRACGLRRRRLKRFRPELRATLVSHYMASFDCLRALPAFRRLEHDAHKVIAALGVPGNP